MKILVIQTAFPGDSILTLPLIQEIKASENNSTIDVLCIPNTKIFFEASPYVNKVISYDKRNDQKGLASFYKMAKTLRAEGYNIVYSPHRSLRSSLLAFLIGAKESISFDKSTFSFLYKTQIPYRSDVHEVQRNLSLLNRSYEDDSWKILPKLTVDNNSKNIINEILSKIDNQNIIVIAPGSVWETKRYPAEYFKIIAKSLSDNGFHIVLIGGREDQDLANIIASDNNNITNLCGKISYIQSIHLMEKSKLVISNDSAPTHLAMCADVPVLTIYCSTVPDFGFYPYNNGSRYISYNDLDCKPCGIHGHKKCPKDHFKCGFELNATQVLTEVYEMLEKRH